MTASGPPAEAGRRAAADPVVAGPADGDPDLPRAAPPPDLRLLAPAGAAWAAAAWAQTAPPPVSLAAAAVAALGALVAARGAVARRSGRRTAPTPHEPSAAALEPSPSRSAGRDLAAAAVGTGALISTPASTPAGPGRGYRDQGAPAHRHRRTGCPPTGRGGCAATRSRGARHPGPLPRALVVAVLVCASGGALAAGARSAVRSAEPVAALAAARQTVDAAVVVTDDPRPARTASVGGRRLLVVPARLERVVAGGRVSRVRVPVVLLASDPVWAALLPSQRVTLRARLAPPRPGDTVAAALSVRGPPDEVAPPSAAHRVAGRLRAGLRAAVEPLPAREQGLLPGLVVGDVSALDPALRDEFDRTGMSHLVAVSGSNVAIVVAAALLAARSLGAGPRAGPLAAAAALVGFVVLARPSPSVLRAGVMGGLGVLALASGRRRSAFPALGAAVLVLVLVEPGLARAPGFALSVAATAGLLVLAPPLRRAFARRLPGPLADASAVAVAAQVAVSPVVAALSAEVSLVAVPANLLAVPAVPPATVLGVLAALTAPVSLPVAQALARVAGVPTTWLVEVAERGARVPAGALPWPGGAAGGLLLAALACLVGLALLRPTLRRGLAAAALGAATGLAALPVLPGTAGRAAWPPAGWALVACDVGQGDALVLAAGPGRGVVVDSGPDPDAVDRCLRDLAVTDVPRVLLTHLHADHAAGLPGVLRGRRVAAVEVGALDDPPGALARVRAAAGAAGVPVETTRLGEVRTAGPLRWDVLGPTRRFTATDDDANNNSLVLRASTGGVTALLPGDVEPTAQRALLAAGRDLRADVLKVPHHGSRHQEPAFLAAPGARVALVTAGEGNTHGHPAPATLRALAGSGAVVARTDTDGAVAVLRRDGRLLVAPQGRR